MTQFRTKWAVSLLPTINSIIQSEAQLANDIQRENPGTSRTEALFEAARLVRELGPHIRLQGQVPGGIRV